MSANTILNGITYPLLADSKDAVANFATMNTVVDTHQVARYANATARDAANPSPIEGQACYLVEEKAFQVRHTTGWVKYGPEQTKFKVSNTTHTNSVTLVADSELYFDADANSRYVVEFYLAYSGPGGVPGGLKCSLAVPLSTTLISVFAQGAQAGVATHASFGFMSPASFSGSAALGFSTSQEYGFGSFDATPMAARLNYILDIGSTAGRVSLTSAQWNASATPTSLLDASYMVINKL